MNKMNTSHANAAASESLAELEEVLADLEKLFAEDDSEAIVDDNGAADDYRRTISIPVPDEAADIHGMSCIDVSIRDFLTWFAANNPEESARVLELRDDFFSGDQEEDYGHFISPSTHAHMTPEKRALARMARSKHREALAEYERTITLPIPNEAADIYGMSVIKVPIRDLLTWFAANNPDEAARVIELRDDFFVIHPDDYNGHFITPSIPMTAEKRVLVKANRAKGREERGASRDAIEAEFQASEAKEREMWLPFLKERAALVAEQEGHWQRADALNAEWDRFVRESERANREWKAREDSVRASLETNGKALCDDQEAWCGRWAELRHKAETAWYQR